VQQLFDAVFTAEAITTIDTLCPSPDSESHQRSKWRELCSRRAERLLRHGWGVCLTAGCGQGVAGVVVDRAVPIPPTTGPAAVGG